jgi:hypothetical protein
MGNCATFWHTPLTAAPVPILYGGECDAARYVRPKHSSTSAGRFRSASVHPLRKNRADFATDARWRSTPPRAERRRTGRRRGRRGAGRPADHAARVGDPAGRARGARCRRRRDNQPAGTTVRPPGASRCGCRKGCARGSKPPRAATGSRLTHGWSAPRRPASSPPAGAPRAAITSPLTATKTQGAKGCPHFPRPTRVQANSGSLSVNRLRGNINHQAASGSANTPPPSDGPAEGDETLEVNVRTGSGAVEIHRSVQARGTMSG